MCSPDCGVIRNPLGRQLIGRACVHQQSRNTRSFVLRSFLKVSPLRIQTGTLRQLRHFDLINRNRSCCRVISRRHQSTGTADWLTVKRSTLLPDRSGHSMAARRTPVACRA